MAKHKPTPTLTERERRFVEAFMGTCAGNGAKAAIKAGYARGSAKVTASRLLTKANVRAAIAARTQADPAVADRETRQRFWTQVMDGRGRFTKVGMKERLKASELLGKSQGDFIDRHEHSGKDGAPIVVTFGGRFKPNGDKA
jgi:phage terminase small subunit